MYCLALKKDSIILVTNLNFPHQAEALSRRRSWYVIGMDLFETSLPRLTGM